MSVQLVEWTEDPFASLYVTYRTCYDSRTPQEIWEDVRSGRVTHEQMGKFIRERLDVGHTAPQEHVWFKFLVANVSRALSHQLVRHHVGISFQQQSQRYVKFRGGDFAYILPPSWEAKDGLEVRFRELMRAAGELYQQALQAGIPGEDARFVIPQASGTNLVVTVNLQELLHIADVRLCTRAQWEIRRCVALMRAQVMKRFPELASYIQPKCGEHRQGFCDEEYRDWLRCPIGRARPHKVHVIAGIEGKHRADAIRARALGDDDFKVVEELVDLSELPPHQVREAAS